MPKAVSTLRFATALQRLQKGALSNYAGQQYYEGDHAEIGTILFMKRCLTSFGSLLIFATALVMPVSLRADTTITAFEDFTLDGLFSSWASATVISSPTNYSVTASGYGSGYKALSPALDATGETSIELTVTLGGSSGASSPISGPIVALVDADGTFNNYAWYGQTKGTHVLKANLAAPSFTSAAGAVPGLDLSKLAFFHLQDDPGSYAGTYTITFELLRLTGAPHPAITSQSYDPATQQFTLTWTSNPTKSYTILYASNLANSFNPLVTDIPANGTSTTATVSMPGGESGFLRIQQQ
jgi:hypothetical protein